MGPLSLSAWDSPILAAQVQRDLHQVLVGEGCHPDKVKVYGPGVEKTGLKANEPTYFTVDCGEAGQGERTRKIESVSL